jgi:hypothetical protein
MKAAGTPTDLRTVRIPIAALLRGVYEYSCDCHGRLTIGRLKFL